jgi:hypothetical protein
VNTDAADGANAQIAVILRRRSAWVETGRVEVWRGDVRLSMSVSAPLSLAVTKSPQEHPRAP